MRINYVEQTRYPKARAVKAQERRADADADAKLSPRHARRCNSPGSSEQAPTTPAISANINIKLVDGFPPKSVYIINKTKQIIQNPFHKINPI